MKTYSAAPVLETERLVLRGHEQTDFDALFAMWGDERVYRHILGRVSTAEECWMRLLRYAGLWPLAGFGYWAVTDRETGRYIGDVGLADFHREIVPTQGGDPEAGWMLHPDFRGRGLAGEAVAAVLDWADRQLNPNRVWCFIDPENAPSLKIAAGCGFIPNGQGHYKDEDVLLFERVRGALSVSLPVL